MIEKRKLFDDDLELMPNNPILTSSFYLKPDNTSSVVLTLNSKCVFYHMPDAKQVRKGFYITFDTIFQILRPKYKAEEKTLGIPFGIKFFSNLTESQEFYSDNVKDLEKWEL